MQRHVCLHAAPTRPCNCPTSVSDTATVQHVCCLAGLDPDSTESWGKDEHPGLPGFDKFRAAAQRGNIVPLYERLFSDRITPVLAYRSLVPEGDYTSPSFLLESVSNGSQQVSPALMHWRHVQASGST